MKTGILTAAAFSLCALFTSMDVNAGITDGLGVWEGTGTARTVGGDDVGRFTVTLTRRSAGTAKVRTEGKVTLVNGQALPFWQEMEEVGSGGFHVTSNNGSGGGRCFENGICQSYEQRKDRRAVATTVVRDAPNKVRVLITEFDKGQAVRLIEETLTKRR